MMIKENSYNWMSVGVTLVVLGLFAGPALAAVDMFIKIEGIPGESQDQSHRDWIDVLSFDMSVSRPIEPGAGGGAAGRQAAQRSDLVLTKYIDKSSPKLALACCEGRYVPEVTPELINTGGGNRTPYMVYKLHNVLVSSYSVSGDTIGGPPPTEEISLNYESIEWTYTEFDSADRPKKDKHVSFWDFVRNAFR